MSKKRTGLIKLSEKLLKLAPAVAEDTACVSLIGEPKLPKNLKKTK